MKKFSYCLLFIICSQLTFSQKNGEFKDFYKSGELKTEGQYKKKKRVGKWKKYHKNGNLSEEYSYEKGKRNKDYKKYFEEGALKQETFSEDNIFITKRYYKDGKIYFERQNKSGYYKEYLKDGTLYIDANYSDYELSGVWTRYYDTGEKEWEVTYIDGYREGLYKRFYKNGQIKIEGTTLKDKKNGVEKMYSDTGDLIQNTSDIESIVLPDGNLGKVPIFPGCEAYLNNKARKKCMSKMVQIFVKTRFNTNVSNNLDLSGNQKIYLVFKIDKKGHVISPRARGPHPDLEKEAIRVIKTLPKLIPGTQRGKTVIVPYSLPIIFSVNKNTNNSNWIKDY